MYACGCWRLFKCISLKISICVFNLYISNHIIINSNEDDLDDDDMLDENSKSGKSKESECASEAAEPSPGPSGSSENPMLGEGDEKGDEYDDKQWPSINDLNTRLRRVITTYQRNYRKEEMKLAQKAKVRLSVLTLFLNSLLYFY